MSAGIRPLLGAVRVTKHLTQTSLALLTHEASGTRGLSQGAISKLEDGALPLDDARAESLAQVLDVPAELLRAPRGDAMVLHHFPSSLPAAATSLVRAQLELAGAHLERIRTSDMGGLTPRLHSSVYTVAEAASWLRARWAVPPGPIESVVNLVEHHGVICVRRDLEFVKTGAVGSWKRDPLLFLDRTIDNLAIRFSIAHELGHAVLHKEPNRLAEKDADEFAYHFLLPAEMIEQPLWNADASRLLDLQAEWGVSALRLAHRAKQVGAISDTRHRKLVAILNSTDFDVPRRSWDERPKAISAEVIRRTRDTGSLTRVADTMLLTPDRLRTNFLAGSSATTAGYPHG